MLSSPSCTIAKLRNSDSCSTTVASEAYRYSCLESFYVPTNSHANCREFGSRVRSRKKNSIGARGRRSIAWRTLYIGNDPLSPRVISCPGRVGFIGPGVRDSFIRRVFGPTFGFERAASVSGLERTKERTLYLSWTISCPGVR